MSRIIEWVVVGDYYCSRLRDCISVVLQKKLSVPTDYRKKAN